VRGEGERVTNEFEFSYPSRKTWDEPTEGALACPMLIVLTRR